jgi:Stress responsive A/B Barrel Domain
MTFLRVPQSEPPSAAGVVRLVATVSVNPALVIEAIERARRMLATVPEVITAEVGVRRDVKTGVVVPGDYVLSLTFSDHDSLVRYANSSEHDEVHEWVRPHLLAEHVAMFEAAPVQR